MTTQDPSNSGPYSLDYVRENLRKSLELQGFDTNALDQGSNHPYECKCKVCWQWWKMMGLGDEENPPFTQMEIDQETYGQAMTLFPPRAR